MKTAIVHDWLMSLGGAERVLEAILELYPSPLFTLFQSAKYDAAKLLHKIPIQHSFIQKMPLVEAGYRHYLPLFPMAIERFDLSSYDLIISSSHAVAKGIKTHPRQLHICYCHTPMRYAWDLEGQYLESASLLKASVAKQVFKFLRNWDLKATSRVDAFIANSHFVAERIKRLYGRESVVIYPPISTHLMKTCEQKENFYLTVSRLVSYKRVDLMIEAFNQTPERKLKIVGVGPLFEKLQKKANSNIEFLGFQPDDAVQDLLSRAKGFIYAAEEDFGIALVEAQASGTPVIAYGRGGALETVIAGQTGLFFPEQTVSCLIEALEEFEKISWNGKLIREHSEKFGVDRFKRELKQFVDKQWEQFCENHHSCRR